jgi:hypothetical protein
MLLKKSKKYVCHCFFVSLQPEPIHLEALIITTIGVIATSSAAVSSDGAQTALQFSGVLVIEIL